MNSNSIGGRQQTISYESRMPEETEGKRKKTSGGRKVDFSAKAGRHLHGHKGLPFSKMTLTQRFVFVLATFSSLLKVTVANPFSTSGIISPDSCRPFGFLEQVGPKSMMPNFPLKPSDEMDATFGLDPKKREKMVVSKKFKSQVFAMECARKHLDIYNELFAYLKKHCPEIHISLYNHNTGTYFKRCLHLKLHECPGNIGIGLEGYDSVLKESIQLLAEGYGDSEVERFPEDTKALTLVHVAKYSSTLHRYSTQICDSADIALKNIDDATVREKHEKEIKKIRGELANLKKKYNRKIVAPWKNKCIKKQGSSCFSESELSKLRVMGEKVNEKALKIADAYKESFGYKALYYSYCLSIAFFCSVLYVPMFLLQTGSRIKFHYRKKKKLNIEEMIEKVDIKPVKDFEVNLDKCRETVSKNKSKNIDLNCGLPAGWSVAKIPPYENFSPSVKKAKKPKKVEGIFNRVKEIVSPSGGVKAPDFPWKDKNIPFVHEKIKPVFRYSKVKTSNNEIISAYAYLDETTLTRAKFEQHEIKKIREIFEDGRIAPHAHGATGYKVYDHNGKRIWEIKIAGGKRLYGVEMPPNEEGKKANVAPLVIFDISLRKKLGGK